MKSLLLGMSAMILVAGAAMYADDAPPAEGAKAPGFTLKSQEGKEVSLKDFKGKWVVLYFYPKDMTKGCTLEAHNFQRDLDKFQAANAVVLGVSFDTTSSHQTFCTKESLSFKLLADPDGKVIGAYGVPVKTYNDMKIASRQTFLIDPSGKIVKTWPDVDADLIHHSENVLAAISAGGK